MVESSGDATSPRRVGCYNTVACRDSQHMALNDDKGDFYLGHIGTHKKRFYFTPSQSIRTCTRTCTRAGVLLLQFYFNACVASDDG